MGNSRSKKGDDSDGSGSYESDDESIESDAKKGPCPFFCRSDNSNEFVASDDIKKQTRHKFIMADNVGKQVEEVFEIRDKSLGEGGFAQVCEGRHKRTGAIRAIKKMGKPKGKLDTKRLRKEIECMQRLDHPNIIKLFQTFEDERCIYMVMEICNGGELFDFIVAESERARERQSAEKCFSEPVAATVMKQIFRAVQYMHSQGVCHRDLKPENFLFETKEPIENNTLKVIDLGICGFFNPDEQGAFSTKTGTPQYVAPEVLSNWWSYGQECDLWSCGVVMYVLLSGTLPFKGRDENDTLNKVRSDALKFGRKFSDISQEAKALIGGLLQKIPAKRTTAEEASNDPWVTGNAFKEGTAPLLPAHVQALKAFQNENKLKKVALTIVARHCDDGQVDQLRDIFLRLDKNGDGLLSTQEMRDGLQEAGLGDTNQQDLSKIMAAIDADGSGEIDYTEFIAASMDHRQHVKESACWAAFRVVDKDDDGRISTDELRAVLKDLNVQRAVGQDTIDEIMREVDTNHDGYIDFPEFMAMMRS